MRGRSSKQSSTKNPYAGRSTGQEKQYSQRQKRRNTMEEGQISVKESQKLPAPYGNASNDEFYDGIPQYRRSSLSHKSRSLREELKVFLEVVVRFGNRCKDPQWHNLDRFFEKHSSDRNPQKLSREVAESVMQRLMTSVQLTAISIIFLRIISGMRTSSLTRFLPSVAIKFLVIFL